jgi:hypothetical protein
VGQLAPHPHQWIGEMKMAHKNFNKFWLIYGRVSGFALGFSVDKFSITIDLGFWYIGLER